MREYSLPGPVVALSNDIPIKQVVLTLDISPLNTVVVSSMVFVFPNESLNTTGGFPVELSIVLIFGFDE